MRTSLFAILLLLGCAVPTLCHAEVAITEVLWAGSDLSSSDEWLELQNFSDTDVDLTGWSLTYLTSKGDDGLIVRFATGTTLDADSLLIVARNHAEASRLLEEPEIVTSSMSLLNTKLLLKLKRPDGSIVDTVDDGVGSPFAGANPSGGVKASMERLDPKKPGTDPANWQTAERALGLDDGAQVFATPGYPFASSEAGPCTDDLEVQIYVQDGSLNGVEKTTVNFQAIATKGSIEKAVCHWQFSDGYSSESCNPPPHSFEQTGVTNVRLEAVNQCGTTLIQELSVTVTGGSSSSVGSGGGTSYDGSRILLSSALPNPESGDTGKEWVELRNLEDHSVSLSGWRLVTGKTTLRQYSLQGFIDARQTLRIYNSETKFTFSNTESIVILRNPAGTDVSTIVWKKADEGRVYFPDDIRSVDVQGKASFVIDGDTFVLELIGEAKEILGKDSVHVRLLGIDAPEIGQSDDPNDVSIISHEFLRALIEGQNVELEFDTDLWDTYGRLLAYVYDSHGILTEQQLIGMGYAVTTDSFEFVRKISFLELQEKARNMRLGLWKNATVSTNDHADEFAQSPQADSQDDINSDEAGSTPDIRISEIYSNPVRALELADKKACLLQECDIAIHEWIELDLGTSASNLQEIRALYLSINGKKKSLQSASLLGSGQFLLLTDKNMSFDIRNAGGVISLLSPSGEVISTLEYPVLKSGQSFQVLHDATVCISDIATPFVQNNCTVKSPIAKTKKATATKKKSVSRIAAAFAPEYREQVDSEMYEELSLSESSGSGFGRDFVLLFFAFLMGVLGSLLGPSLCRLLKIGK